MAVQHAYERKSHRIAYDRILVPLVRTDGSEQAMAIACELAADHGAHVVATTVIEVPAELPLDAHMPRDDEDARRLLRHAAAIADLRGVEVKTHVVRARSAGAQIVDDAIVSQSEIIVLSASRRRRLAASTPIFGRTVEYVLKHAQCRVMVAATPR